MRLHITLLVHFKSPLLAYFPVVTGNVYLSDHANFVFVCPSSNFWDNWPNYTKFGVSIKPRGEILTSYSLMTYFLSLKQQYVGQIKISGCW